MIKVYQTQFKGSGNCLEACLASLLEVSISFIPSFPKEGQWLHMERFLRTRGLAPVGFGPDGFKAPYNTHYLIWGFSPRDIRHSCIGLNGEIVHDPHLDGGGVTGIYQYVIFAAFPVQQRIPEGGV